METASLVLLVSGLILFLLEVVIPGGISFSMGFASIIIAILYQFNLLKEPVSLFFIWCFVSVFIGSVSIYFSNKLFSGKKIKGFFNEDLDAMGKIVDVKSEINNLSGRIFFQGTSWDAKTFSGIIKTGEKAKIVARDNITWIVEPVKMISNNVEGE